MTPTLSRRALNRATLARQLLLERSDRTVPDAIEHLVGLQAQTPQSWYVSLWSRLAGLDPNAVGSMVEATELVRIALMRSTIHLVTAADAWRLRPLMASVLGRALSGNFGRHLVGVDEAALLAAGREIVEAEPQLFSSLGRALAERFPGRDPAALAQAIRAWVPLVQVPPRGVWRRSGAARHTTLEALAGPGPVEVATLEDLVRRFLGAFGPASVKDAQAWCGLTRLGEVVERLAPELVRFRGEDGTELVDLPGAPRPDPEVGTPVRFLPDYDNLLLSHADRSRFAGPLDVGHLWSPHGPVPGPVLVDGVVRGGWFVRRTGRRALLDIQAPGQITRRDAGAVAEEGARLLELWASDADDHDIVITRVDYRSA